MATEIHLVRHAAHDRLGRVLTGRMTGVRLGPEGRAQADRLAGHFADMELAAVYSSPMERALETAAPIGERSGRPVEILAAANEIDFGDWAGQDFEALARDPRWTHWNAARSIARTPGGETMLAVQARMVGAVERIGAAHPHGRVVLVSHGDVLKAGLAYYLGMTLDHLQRFEIGPASISVLELFADAARVLVMNRTLVA